MGFRPDIKHDMVGRNGQGMRQPFTEIDAVMPGEACPRAQMSKKTVSLSP
jgi:hypothetical protein